jgi:hypothetical protein
MLRRTEDLPVYLQELIYELTEKYGDQGMEFWKAESLSELMLSDWRDYDDGN